MHDMHDPGHPRLTGADLLLRGAIVALALAAGYIHWTLGGLLFSLNAIGFAVGALGMLVPFEWAEQHRWPARVGLAAYAATTLGMWFLQGPRYSTAFLAAAIELLLIGMLALDFVRRDRELFTRGTPRGT
jgi:hypothetical protein